LIDGGYLPIIKPGIRRRGALRPAFPVKLLFKLGWKEEFFI